MGEFDRIDAFLAETGHDGYLLDDDSTNSDQRYLSGYFAKDPFVTLYTPSGTHLLIKGLEYNLAKRESRADVVHRPADYGYSPYGSAADHRDCVAAFLDDVGVASVAVPNRFPAGHADGLRDRGVTVAPEDEGVVTRQRAVKTDDELAEIRAAQRANEAAMAAVEDLLAGATRADGVLRHDGDPLTSERVREAIEGVLRPRGYDLDAAVVAGGRDAADPHERGSGPLPADEAIVVDIYPYDEATHYHADMTRTFAVGDPGAEMRERYRVTREALRQSVAAVEPGVTGAAVHDVVCDVYEDAGYATLRSDPETEVGFIHATGHGVGLDTHELPSVGPGGAELEPGHVVTVEPGLYDPAVGGVRLEDVVVVTEDGHENLTEYGTELVVGDD